MATNGNFGQQEQYKGALEAYPNAPSSGDAGNANEGSGSLTKDQVGWYFVEQFYTTLSKSPEKLHLFYSKQSQFVYGQEAEVANVSVGRQNIQERIKQLDFQDCKVRVSNVDSQASFDNIVIQVIGETSNKAQEPKKFVQTFVLAQQPSGYFVLNDILRYINEDVEEETAEQATEATPAQETAAEPEAPADVKPATSAVTEDAKALDAEVVDEKLETAQDAPKVNGKAEEVAAVEEKPAPVSAEPAAPSADTAAREVAEEDQKETEKPKEPAPTPVTKPAAETKPAPAAEPAAPPKPMTWASRAAAAAGPRPVVPLPKTATPPASSQSRAPAPAAAPATTAAPTPAAAATNPAPAAAAAAPAKENSEWQTAGADSKRQNRPQSISAGAGEKEGTMGYVKFVTDKVQDAELKNALTAHGELTYFDINRQKNCAFVEFKSAEGCSAAIAASPFTVNGENLVIEPRRPKATAYGGSNYGSGRGGAAGRGRGGFEGGRSGGNPRGNYGGQGRGGRGGASRGGRGGAQSTNA